jgi:hypothetical protein
MPGRNGKHSPPRPKIEMAVAQNATEEEAAAIAAALEQFLVETAPAPQDSPPRSGWQNAALRDGVSARAIEPGGWGSPGTR